MSASDLAPIAASALQERVSVELKEEIAEVKPAAPGKENVAESKLVAELRPQIQALDMELKSMIERVSSMKLAIENEEKPEEEKAKLVQLEKLPKKRARLEEARAETARLQTAQPKVMLSSDGGTVNAKLMKENDQLERERERSDALRFIGSTNKGLFTVTGKGGSPVYAFVDLADVRDSLSFREAWLKNEGLINCKMSKLGEAEIRINGMFFYKLKDANKKGKIFVDDDYKPEGAEFEHWFYRVGADTHGVPGWENLNIELDISFGPTPDRYRYNKHYVIHPEELYPDKLDDSEIKIICFDFLKIYDPKYVLESDIGIDSDDEEAMSGTAS